jgi:four helix bundle protein
MNKYCSLVAWQAAHSFVIATFKTTDRYFSAKARPIFDQLRRAAVSIEANIVEGYALDTKPQFRRHLRIARGSAAEAECLLRILKDLDYLSSTQIKQLHQRLEPALKTIKGLLHSGGPA